MNLSESVFEIAESFMKRPDYVSIKEAAIEGVAEEMIHFGAPKFNLPEESNIHKGILLELIAGSINYCYWYGKSDIRPFGSNSTKMFDLVLSSFDDFEFDKKNSYTLAIDTLCKMLSISRFPMLEERIKHLRELDQRKVFWFIECILSLPKENNAQKLMESLIQLFPGYASDIFLKRASLFFIQLFRRFGWFNNDLKTLHVPADYQIPKMLEHYGCINYYYALKLGIDNNDLIQKGSQAECEIRSATILVIKKLCELTQWNVAEVDSYFFLKRHGVNTPFHLTVTTDY